jgi:uncharacterized protein (DUF4415 family)
MLIEFDSEKRVQTLADRGLDFADAPLVMSGDQLTMLDTRIDYGEARFITVGFIESIMVMVVWTPRGEVRRIISMRKCNERKHVISSDLASAIARPISAEEYAEMPELDDAFFEHADMYVGNKLVRRGRPVQDVTKTPIKLRLDPDIIATFKAQGRGWQTRMNDALREWMNTHSV